MRRAEQLLIEESSINNAERILCTTLLLLLIWPKVLDMRVPVFSDFSMGHEEKQTERGDVHTRNGRCSAGFSLMEVMVALFLIGLVLTLAAQSSVSTFERWQESIDAKNIRNQISRIPVKAHASMRELNLSEQIENSVIIPDRWVVQAIKDTDYSRAGYCGEGSFYIRTPKGRTRSYEIYPPTCRAVEIR